MKIAALMTVLALATAPALAQHSGKSESSRAAGKSATTAQSGDSASSTGEGVGAKTKRAFSRAGEKIRNTGERIGRRINKDDSTEARASGSDTRAMGGPSTDTSDRARQARMDEAYNNWKSRQK